MQILRTIIIILIIFWVIPWIFRKVGPILVRRFVEKRMGSFQNAQNGMFEEQVKEAKKREGEVQIKRTQKKNNSQGKEFEDVDFEEIKE